MSSYRLVECPVCGKKYELTRVDKRYCSSNCRHKAHNKKRPEATCEKCGKRYIPRRDDQRFCSTACRRSPRVRTEIECENCGKIFMQKRSNQRYCSVKCRHQQQYIRSFYK